MARVLIIDDSDQIRLSIRMALEDAGYEVEEAADGNVGIQLYKENPADLIISDLIMPDKEGLETITELLKNFPESKIIAISGDCRIDPGSYLFIAKKLGALRTFSKPIDLAELIDAVGELLK